MKCVASMLRTDTQTVRQLPPKLKSLYNNSRAGFPLGFGHVSSYVRSGVALIGWVVNENWLHFYDILQFHVIVGNSDAAHRVHPLAGMGLNLGFGDAKALAEILAKATYSGSKLGDMTHLRDYETKQLQTNVPIMLGIHGLQRLYGTTIGPVVLARSVGLQITQTVTPLKVSECTRYPSHVTSECITVYARCVYAVYIIRSSRISIVDLFNVFRGVFVCTKWISCTKKFTNTKSLCERRHHVRLNTNIVNANFVFSSISLRKIKKTKEKTSPSEWVDSTTIFFSLHNKSNRFKLTVLSVYVCFFQEFFMQKAMG